MISKGKELRAMELPCIVSVKGVGWGISKGWRAVILTLSVREGVIS